MLCFVSHVSIFPSFGGQIGVVFVIAFCLNIYIIFPLRSFLSLTLVTQHAAFPALCVLRLVLTRQLLVRCTTCLYNFIVNILLQKCVYVFTNGHVCVQCVSQRNGGSGNFANATRWRSVFKQGKNNQHFYEKGDCLSHFLLFPELLLDLRLHCGHVLTQIDFLFTTYIYLLENPHGDILLFSKPRVTHSR